MANTTRRTRAGTAKAGSGGAARAADTEAAAPARSGAKARPTRGAARAPAAPKRAPARGAKRKDAPADAGTKAPKAPKARKPAPGARGKSLVIVESPTKSRTLSKFLGRGFTVMASNGHVMDLPKSQLGVDIDNNFEPE